MDRESQHDSVWQISESADKSKQLSQIADTILVIPHFC